jgi:hypothetical protein
MAIIRLSILLLIFSFNLSFSFQSYTLSGVVIDKSTGDPIEFCAIGLVGSTTGTITDKEGKFSLSGLPDHKFTLVFSHIAYENKVLKLSPKNTDQTLTIRLNPKVVDLDEVSISAKGRGKLARQRRRELGNFMKMVLGTEYNERLIQLVNEEVIDIRDLTSQSWKFSKNYDLVFVNEYLGYEIKYYDFSFIMNKTTKTFIGYPVFKELTPKEPEDLVKWKKNREEAFKGSLKHLLFSLISDSLIEEGFLVNITNFDPTSNIDSKDYERVSNALRTGPSAVNPNLKLTKVENDNYEMWVDGTIELFFTNPADDTTEVSYILLKNETTKVSQNGNLHNPLSLMVYGHLANLGVYKMLPVNYLPDYLKSN